MIETININLRIKNYGLVTAIAAVLVKVKILFLPWIILFGVDTVISMIEWFFGKIIKIEFMTVVNEE